MTSQSAHLWEAQRTIETEAAEQGVRRFRRTIDKAREAGREDQTQVGSAMVKRIKAHMVPMFREDLERRAAGKATKGGVSLKELRDLDPEAVCEAAIRAALSIMSRPLKLALVCRRIGEALEDQVVWARWRKLNRRQADAVYKRVQQSPSKHQRRAALRGFARNWEARALADAWSAYKLIGVGMHFVDYLVRLEVFEMTKIAIRRPKGKPSQAAHGVQLTAQAAERAKELADYLATARPLNWPLVAPPIPWTTPSGGGFHFREAIDSPLLPQALKPLPLVRWASKEQKALLAKADLSVVYAGLNAAQATAWRINPKVYAVLAHLIKEGHGPGITAYDPKPEPGRLPDEEAKDPEKLRAHKGELRKAKRHNVRMRSKRLSQHRVFNAAQKFVTEPAIYFAYNLDFRGRVYACSDDLSPQGNDLQRGLLEFAQGDPLDDEGMRWLKVHLANCYGVDKVSFEERVKWADDHAATIFAVAHEPLDTDWWHKADQPWQFLAACFAFFEGVALFGQAPCRVPVMLDGSCSGIQHYAALLRDEEAGREVNLVPGDKPGDLYATVAKRVMENLAASRDPFAMEWHSWGIDRKLVKRSVMVLPYGGTFRSHLDYVRDSARARLEAEGRPKWLTEENERDAFIALAKFVWKAMREVVKGPLAGMAWVKKLIKAWAEQRGHRKLQWVAPCGLPVVTNYPGHTPLLANTKGTIDGQAVQIKYIVEVPDVTNWNHASTAGPPNFVHSLDASHLLCSLARAKEEGISNLAVVHDAFGTTPTKTAQFARILREEFASLYMWTPFHCLVDAARKIGVEAPELPPMGTLKMEGIRQSPYLFA